MSDSVWDTPLVPPSPDIPSGVQVTNPADVPPPASPIFKGLPVRGVGDNIYLLRGGKRFWVTSPEVYSKLGFKFGDEVKLDEETLSIIPEGEPLR